MLLVKRIMVFMLSRGGMVGDISVLCVVASDVHSVRPTGLYGMLSLHRGGFLGLLCY